MKNQAYAMKYTEGNEGGFRKYPYVDTKGYHTIGVGHKLPGPPSEDLKRFGISRIKGLLQFKEDYGIAIEDARAGFPNFDTLPAEAQMVLSDMAFQMGRSNLMEFTRMRAAIARRDFNEAAWEALDSEYAKKDTPRRDKERSHTARGAR
jgi:GH24 family phage-related lysozyme (muramidase)